ncbi:hypothetical protein [Gordonia liuliyuniae]|uniref:Phosphodiesterase n=1 Tax=Gordonia liuliyuniae TaxID=2911517 RepID=A0ABS9IUH4_9ACTN|nr:hypothetical protein [Gordonia liuliyuniae]MCF8589220.1 hypothetical protein [Gordonia liuliyuniae]
MNSSTFASVVDPVIDRLTPDEGGRMLHRNGLVFAGHFVAESSDLPIASGPVTVRVSKALGLPGKAPDVVGAAVRFLPEAAGDSGWDLMLGGPARRIVRLPIVRPAIGWGRVPLAADCEYNYGEYDYGEYDYGESRWRISGELLAPTTGTGLDTHALTRALSQAPAVLTLAAKCEGAPTAPIGTVEFGGAQLPDDIDFDPMRTPQRVRPVRDWWDDVCRAGYRGRNG